MIYLHTFGDALITVGEKEVRPTAPMIFAALLYLCVERGHRVSRTALQEMLFPEADERSGAHSLRQLLYKLRQLGVPVEADATSIMVPARAVHEPQNNGKGNPGTLETLTSPLLPGYEPDISPRFGQWLEERRAEHVTQGRKMALAALTHARESGNYQRADAAASALLRLDPLNEEATLARAEALALSGQKHDAVKLLDEYAEEVGKTSPQLRLSADVLKRRITDRLAVRERPAVPLLGRDDELSLLLAHFQRAASGQGTVSIIWGDAGIGKTRLVQEFSANIALRAARLETAHCQPHDVGRPLGALIDLVPKLLNARGALGVSPESLRQLRRVTGDLPIDSTSFSHSDPLFVAARFEEALRDLLACVFEEHPLVILVEDAHWLDETSMRLLLSVMAMRRSRLHVVLTQRGHPSFVARPGLSEFVFVRRLEPLATPAAASLLDTALGVDCDMDASVIQQCLSLAGGNPLFLCTIAQHLRYVGTAPDGRFGVMDLLRQRIRLLDERSLLLLRTIATLGNHSTSVRLNACLGLSPEFEMLALQSLAERGLVVRKDGAIQCSHDVLTQVVLEDTPQPILVAIREKAAAVLEADGKASSQARMLWSSAENWKLAENHPRAATVLRLCARVARDNGQPQFAYSALEKAQELIHESELLPLLEESINAAERAFDSDAVLANVARYRTARYMRGIEATIPPSFELAEINAWRRNHRVVWQHNARLRHCIMDRTIGASERLRAARLFLYIAEQQLEKSAALQLFAGLDPDEFLDLERDWLHVRMFFNCFFGDISQARADAEQLASICADGGHSIISMLGNIGTVLFRSGATNAGVDALERSIREEEKMRLTHLLINDCARIVGCFIALGDRTSATTWHDKTLHHLREVGRKHVPAYLANCIDFDLLDKDYVSARQHLGVLSNDYADSTTPYNRRICIGYSLQIGILAGTINSADDLAMPMHLDEKGREFSEHDILAFGLAGALNALGRRGEAKARLSDYLVRFRRERVPLTQFLISAVQSLELDSVLLPHQLPSAGRSST